MNGGVVNHRKRRFIADIITSLCNTFAKINIFVVEEIIRVKLFQFLKASSLRQHAATSNPIHLLRFIIVVKVILAPCSGKKLANQGSHESRERPCRTLHATIGISQTKTNDSNFTLMQVVGIQIRINVIEKVIFRGDIRVED